MSEPGVEHDATIRAVSTRARWAPRNNTSAKLLRNLELDRPLRVLQVSEEEAMARKVPLAKNRPRKQQCIFNQLHRPRAICGSRARQGRSTISTRSRGGGSMPLVSHWTKCASAQTLASLCGCSKSGSWDRCAAPLWTSPNLAGCRWISLNGRLRRLNARRNEPLARRAIRSGVRKRSRF